MDAIKRLHQQLNNLHWTVSRDVRAFVHEVEAEVATLTGERDRLRDEAEALKDAVEFIQDRWGCCPDYMHWPGCTAGALWDLVKAVRNWPMS